MPLTARMWSLVLAVLWVAPAHAGVIRGNVKVRAAAAAAHAPQAYAGRAGSMAHGHASSRPSAADAVVSIERVAAAVESTLVYRSNAFPRLAQKNQAFVPRVLAVAVGTVVEFPNQDPIFHNVFSVSPVRRFDLGKYPRGQSRRVTFNKQGLVEVYCDIHSDMAAFIVVLPNHAFAQPNGRGDFELPELPAGEYVLKVWHPDLPESRRTVVVPAAGEVEVEIAY